MGTLKSNVDHYMKLKGIESYRALLYRVALEKGITGKEAYDFAKEQSSNFSKMLKNERTLKRDFIIPLESIFGVSLDRLLNEDAYKLPVEKNNVPFIKGFSYYAYIDEPKLYEEELSVLNAKNGDFIIKQADEFGKTFLDYIVEYNSVNGVRYLHREYGIKIKGCRNIFEYMKNSHKDYIYIFTNVIEFARMVANMNDVELFNDIFDTYYMFLLRGDYVNENILFCQSEYLEIVLDNDALFKSIFKTRSYEFEKVPQTERKKQTYSFINPIINNCLRYALKHLNKHRKRAIEILNFGIKHNKTIASKIDMDRYCICNELGGVIDRNQMNYYNCDVEDIAVFVDIEVKDDEIGSLIEKLPKFTERKGWALERYVPEVDFLKNNTLFSNDYLPPEMKHRR